MEEDGTLSIGTRLGEFEIRGLVGIGGFGIVYRAFDHDLEREVAIKEYMPGLLASRTVGGQVQARGRTHAETFEAGRRSFMLEAKMLARFDHPALVKVFRFWEGNGTAYMVMPLYTGQTLAQALKQLPGPPTETWLMGVLVPLLGALEALHSQQIFHRDVAPDNILLLRNGRPVLLDFGAARQVISDRTQTLTAILKPNYAPIEQYAEVPNLRQGPWTDLYALGAVVYASLTGKPPPPAAARTVQDDLVPLADVAARLEAEHGLHYSATFLGAWQQTLAVRPNERPQSVQALLQLLGLMPSTTGFDHDSTVIAPVTRPPGRVVDDNHTVVVTGMPFGATQSPSPRTGLNAPTGRDMRMVPPDATRQNPAVSPSVPPPVPPASTTAPPLPPPPPPTPPPPATPDTAPRSSTRGGLVTAVLVAAVVLGIGGYVLMQPSRGDTDLVAAASAPASSASTPALTASAATARSETPIITEYPEAASATGAGAPAPVAVNAASATVQASPAASRPDKAALAAARASAAAARAEAASRAAAAARKPEPDVPAPPPAPPVVDRPVSRPAPNASEARSSPPAGPRSPDEVCGNRQFLARQMCHQEACANPEFSRHPICVDLRRRAEEERRRELYGG